MLLCPVRIADQSKYLLQPLKDPLVAVAAADNGVFIPQTLLGSIESLATTRNRGFLRLFFDKAGQSEVRDLPTSVGILAVSARALHATSLCEG